MGIVEAYVVADFGVFLQLTDGNIVRIENVKELIMEG